MNLDWKRRLVCVICYTGVFVSLLYAGYLVWIIVNVPFAGIDVTVEGKSVVIDSVEPYSWITAHIVDKRDKLLLIDGMPAMKKASVIKSGYVDHASKITIIRGEKRYEYTTGHGFSFFGAFISFFVPIILYLICFLMACFLFKFINKNKSIPVLILFLATFAPILLNISAYQRLSNWTGYYITFSMCISLNLFIHFLINYFESMFQNFIAKLLLIVLYICAVFVFMGRIYFQYPLELVFTLFAFIIAIYLIVKLYIKTRKKDVARIIQVLLSGVFLSLFPFVFLYALPNLFFNQSIVIAQWTTPFLALLPITLFYLVITTSLVDISFIIGRLSYYSVISLVLTIISLSGYFILNRSNTPIVNYFGPGLLLFVLTFIILYVKEYIDFRLREWLFPRRKDYQMSLNRFLKRMKPGYKLSDLASITKNEIERILPVEKANLVRIKSHQNEMDLMNDLGTDPSEYSKLPLFDPQGKIQINSVGFSFVLSNNHRECIALVGKWKQPRRQLNVDEKIWFETLINYTQISIENLYKADELIGLIDESEKVQDGLPQTVKKALIKVSERERAQLSQDLHDTVVQDQLALARDIDAEQMHWPNSEFATILNQIRGRILNNVDTLRQVIRDLHPRFIFLMPFNDALNQLFQMIEQRASFSLHVYMDNDFRVFSPDLQTNVYRVIQELLNNAIKHSQAENVTFTVSREVNYLLIMYDDDGVGMDTQQIDPSFSTMGLSGVIERVKSVDGKIIFGSMKDDAEKKGLHVEVEWPID
ncbi:MAG: ATP-binding protein [Sporolactobacillus sp.]